MAAYYNEFDPYAAQWLRNLIAAGHIAAGDVDERSICDVDSADLAGFTQCHFFAGIGVWSHALRLAGWPDDRPVWTGSCPCQPFSAAGKGRGFDDERHLWPEFFRLIRERRPAIVFGEQVASKDGLEWLDLVQADLEGAGYASAAADICAAGLGAPHIRQRLWWVANAGCVGREVALQQHRSGLSANGLGQTDVRGGDGALGRMANGSGARLEGRDEGPLGRECAPTERGDRAGWVADSARLRHGEHQRDTGAMAGTRGRDESQEPQLGRLAQTAGDCGEDGGVEHANGRGRRPQGVLGAVPAVLGTGQDERVTSSVAGLRSQEPATSPTNGHWRDADWLYCRDGKWRPVEPGTFPLAHGATSRVGRLRAYGNAIVPQVAQAFVTAFMECRP